MMQVSHYSSGALVGKFIPNPVISFITGVILHFLIDKIPHFWPANPKAKKIFTVFDFCIAIPMILLVFYFYHGNSQAMLWGFVGSAIVDIVLVATPLYKTKIGQWHTLRQPHHTEIAYLFADIIFTTVCLGLIFYL